MNLPEKQINYESHSLTTVSCQPIPVPGVKINHFEMQQNVKSCDPSLPVTPCYATETTKTEGIETTGCGLIKPDYLLARAGSPVPLLRCPETDWWVSERGMRQQQLPSSRLSQRQQEWWKSLTSGVADVSDVRCDDVVPGAIC